MVFFFTRLELGLAAETSVNIGSTRHEPQAQGVNRDYLDFVEFDFFFRKKEEKNAEIFFQTCLSFSLFLLTTKKKFLLGAMGLYKLTFNTCLS